MLKEFDIKIMNFSTTLE